MRADFVLGDRDGTTCEPAFTQFVRETLVGAEEAGLLAAVRADLEDDPATALQQLVNQITNSRSNVELLLRLQRSS